VRYRLNAPLTATVVAAAVFFAWLAERVTAGQTMPFDLSIRGEVHALASGALTGAMLVVTWLGSGVVLVPATVFLVWRLARGGHRRAAWLLGIAVAGGDLLELVLKLVFQRPRPEAFFVTEPTTYSFPSGHSVESCVFYGTVAAIFTAGLRPAWKVAGWAVAVLMVAAIGFSRIYLGVHWPTDVLGGYDLGVGWQAAVRVGYRVRDG
jgi:undecaprenyl-diphosphatase